MPANRRHPKPQRNLITFPGVSRRAYWIGTGVITAVLIALSLLAGFYYTELPEGDPDTRVSSGHPILELIYTPLGNATVLLVLQFLAANVLFFIGAWMLEKRRG
ncbi:MAG: hypothetical protein AAGI68_15815 [Planctomycetota bacterium]